MYPYRSLSCRPQTGSQSGQTKDASQQRAEDGRCQNAPAGQNDCKDLVERNGIDLFALRDHHDHEDQAHGTSVVPLIERKTASRKSLNDADFRMQQNRQPSSARLSKTRHDVQKTISIAQSAQIEAPVRATRLQ